MNEKYKILSLTKFISGEFINFISLITNPRLIMFVRGVVVYTGDR